LIRRRRRKIPLAAIIHCIRRCHRPVVVTRIRIAITGIRVAEIIRRDPTCSVPVRNSGSIESSAPTTRPRTHRPITGNASAAISRRRGRKSAATVYRATCIAEMSCWSKASMKRRRAVPRKTAPRSTAALCTHRKSNSGNNQRNGHQALHRNSIRLPAISGTEPPPPETRPASPSTPHARTPAQSPASRRGSSPHNPCRQPAALRHHCRPKPPASES